MLFLCIFNKVVQKFKYYPLEGQNLPELADKLGIVVHGQPSPHQFAQEAIQQIADENTECYAEEADIERDPWDMAKVIRNKHAKGKML